MEHFYPIEFYSTFASLKNGYTSSQAAAASALSMAERSYPMSEVKGSGLECQAAMAQEWPRGATPHPRPEAVPERSHPTSEVRGGGERSHLAPKARGSGREEQPHARGQGWRPGGATPCPRSSGCAGAGGLEEPSHAEGQEGQW